MLRKQFMSHPELLKQTFGMTHVTSPCAHAIHVWGKSGVRVCVRTREWFNACYFVPTATSISHGPSNPAGVSNFRNSLAISSHTVSRSASLTPASI